MTVRGKVRFALLGILLLTILAGIVDYPKGPDLRIGEFSRELKVHLGLDLQGGTSLLYTADVAGIVESERSSALEGVRDVIERRINAFGVGEPNIQTIRSGSDWRILVELPGVTDISEAIRRIGDTPLLEFKTEGPPPEFSEEQKEEIRTKNVENKAKAAEILQKALSEGADFEALAREFSEDPGSKDKGGDLGEFFEGDMVPAFNEVVFQKAEVGKLFPEIVETDFGYHILRVDERTDANPEADQKAKAKAHHILFRKFPEKPPVTGPFYKDVVLTGEHLERADVNFDEAGLPAVSLSFNKEGEEIFANVTRENIGKTIAIYLDSDIISAPTVQTEIPNGQAQITGNFTLEEARDLALRLNTGALPVPITLVSQQNIGPTIGQVAVERSFFAGIVGIVLLAFFLIVYYRLPGVMATVALAIYTLLLLAIFKLGPVTLTLAGVAGFILSIGMAVDANVLIFERMKEELRAGKPLTQSMDDGFARAWTSIRDSNFSSLITCFILYWFGSSLIRGFAITLALGIVVSMFSAITITRNFLRSMPVNRHSWYGVAEKREELTSS